MNKEQVYDDIIYPLMNQIIEVCQEHGIAMISSYYIPTDEDPLLCCTSMLPDGDGESGPNHKVAFAALAGGTTTLTLRTEGGDEDTILTSFM